MDDINREIQVVAERAKVLFDEMGWTYGIGEHPTVERLKQTLRELYDNCVKNLQDECEDHSTYLSGRLRVDVWRQSDDVLCERIYSLELLSVLPNETMDEAEDENKMRGLR